MRSKKIKSTPAVRAWAHALAHAGALALGWALAVACPVSAEVAPIATDRPGLLFSSSVVGDGIWQIEAGVPSHRDEAGGARSHTESLVVAIRRGLGERWELRLGSSLSRLDSNLPGSEAQSGIGDLELGAKVALRDSASGGPSIALIPSVVLPTGDDELSSGHAITAVNGVASLALGPTWSSTVVAGVRGGRSGGDAFLESFLGGLVGRSLPWPGWSGYLEAGWTEPDEGAGVGVVGAGVTRLIGRDVQLDVSVGHGITGAASDWRLELGASARF